MRTKARVRCDLTERAIAELDKPQPDPQSVIQSLLVCDAQQAAAVLQALPTIAGKRRSAKKRRRRKRKPDAATQAKPPES